MADSIQPHKGSKLATRNIAEITRILRLCFSQFTPRWSLTIYLITLQKYNLKSYRRTPTISPIQSLLLEKSIRAHLHPLTWHSPLCTLLHGPPRLQSQRTYKLTHTEDFARPHAASPQELPPNSQRFSRQQRPHRKSKRFKRLVCTILPISTSPLGNAPILPS